MESEAVELIGVPVPSGVEVRKSKIFGRGLYSKRDLSPGKTVLSSPEPLVHTVLFSKRKLVCAQCLAMPETLSRCGGCKVTYYCGSSCQKKDWPLHRAECKHLVRFISYPAFRMDTVRLILRALQKQKMDAENKLDLLYSDVACLSDELKESLEEFMHEMAPIIEEDKLNRQDVRDMFCKVVCNRFSISDHKAIERGSAVYWLPSLLNHSCDPNCTAVYNGLQLNIRTIKNVNAGDQLFFCYRSDFIVETKERRRSQLSLLYSFQCNCERCHGEDEAATGLLAAATDDIPASIVKTTVDEGLQMIDDIIYEMKKANNWQGVEDLCQRLILQYTALLSPFNVVLIILRREMLMAQIELNLYKEALKTAEELHKPFQRHYPKYSVYFTEHLLLTAKLRQKLGTSEQLKLSIEELTQALDLVVISHGLYHPLTLEVQELLHKTQHE